MCGRHADRHISQKRHVSRFIIINIIVTQSVQPEPPAVAIVRQNGRSSASCRASVAVTPDLVGPRWSVDGRPQAPLHTCGGRSPSLVLVQICVDPQAGAVSRIRRRIFVRRKSAEKVRLAEYAICCHSPSFLHVKSAENT